MIWIILGLLFVFVLYIAGHEDLPEEEDEILLYYDEERARTRYEELKTRCLYAPIMGAR